MFALTFVMIRNDERRPNKRLMISWMTNALLNVMTNNGYDAKAWPGNTENNLVNTQVEIDQRLEANPSQVLQLRSQLEPNR